tara:strand:+ start:92 stop:424 length:333 start_codon:yes stop_codon:yes gene_type:complete
MEEDNNTYKQYLKYVIIPAEKVDNIESTNILKFSYDNKYAIVKFIVYPHLSDEDATPRPLKGYKQYTESDISKVLNNANGVWSTAKRNPFFDTFLYDIEWKKFNPINWFI